MEIQMVDAGAPVLRQASPQPEAVPCDVCGGPTFERHCEVICLRCGYKRDCSDP